MSETIAGREEKDGPFQRLLSESALEALEMQLQKPLRLSAVDLCGIVTRGVAVLSIMSAELGVVLRIRIQDRCVPISADFENIRRTISALLIHLLTISKSQACVSVSVENQTENDKPGISLRLSVNNVAVPWSPHLDAEDESDYPREISICRRLMEKNEGSLSVQAEENEALVFTIWLPVKGPGRK